MERTREAATTQAMAVAMSLEETGFDLEEWGRIREEILAGKEAKAEGEGGGGGEGKEGKKGILVGVEVSKGYLGVVGARAEGAGGEEEGGCESWGEKGW